MRGLTDFKIEGRMKTALYVATVCGERTAKRSMIIWKIQKLYEEHMPWYRTQIASCTYRQFTTGFFMEDRMRTRRYAITIYVKEYTYLGIVGEVDAEGRCALSREINSVSVNRLRS